MHSAPIYVPFFSAEEVAVAIKAVDEFRQGNQLTAVVAPTPQVPDVEANKEDAAVSARIYSGLTWRPLGTAYERLLDCWLDAPDFLGVELLASKVGVSIEQIRAMISKLSGRMKRFASPVERERLRTALMILVDIEYDVRGSSQHRLTPAGRLAVRRYLGR